MPGSIALCTYRVKPGKEKTFEGLLAKHWPTLREQGLVTAKRLDAFKGKDEGGGVFYVELLEWKDADAANEMGMCVEDRGGRPGMEFPHVERLRLPEAK
jgi:hypothetical protein